MLLLLKLFWCLVSLFPHQLIFSRPYSRRLEAEADQVGLQLAAKVSLVHFGTGSLNCLRHKKASCKQIQLYRECKALSSRLWLLNSRGHCCQIKIRVSLCPVCACVRACVRAQACADVRAGPVFWQQMEIRDQLSGEPSLPEWLSTHPSHRNRITQLDRLIPQV